MNPGWYRAYPSAEDQSLGGLLMWAVGGAVDMLAVLVLLARYLGAQDLQTTEPDHDRARTART
jgi:cytochrome c oxidase assembly factor CtaG